MATFTPPVYTVVGFLIAAVIGDSLGLTGAAATTFAVAGGVGTLVAWWYSPAASHNGGWGMRPAKKQQWGFTSEPQEDQPEPDADEAFSWRPSGLLNTYYTENQPEEGRQQ